MSLRGEGIEWVRAEAEETPMSAARRRRGAMRRRFARTLWLLTLLPALASCGGGAYRQYDVLLSGEAREAQSAFYAGEYDRAVESYARALESYEAMGDEAGVLYCLERMGWIQRELGEYGRALELFRRAYPIAERLNGDAAEIDANLGDVYLFSGDRERARRHYLKTLETLKEYEFKTSYSRPPNSRETAEMVRKVTAIVHARDNLGVLHYFGGEYEEALLHLEKADELIDRVLLVADHPLYGVFFTPPPDLYEGIGFCRTFLGAVKGESGRLEEAWEAFDAGREAFLRAGKEYGLLVNRALRFQVEFRATRVRIDEAKFEAYERLLEEADRFGALEVSWRMCHEIGRALARDGKLEQARGYLARAVDALEVTRSRLREDTVKQMFASSVQDVYAEMIELLFRMARFEEGFDYLERAKARAFLDMLAGRSLTAAKGVDELLVQREREIQERLDALVRKLRATLGKERRKLHRAYRDLLEERERVLEAVKEQSLEYAAATTVTTIPASRIASRLDDRTALVSYFVGRDRVLAWVVYRGDVTAAAAEIEAEALGGLVTDYRQAVADRRERRIEALGRTLAEVVLRPVEPKIEGAKRLFIVPSRSLHYLPFATLPTAEGRFLVQERTVCVLPNASSLFFLDKEVTDDTDRLLAVGNPERGEGVSNLVFAEKEVASIARRFSRPEVRVGADATETALKETELVGRGIIHIAAHGRYDRKEPLKSALLLAEGEGNDGDLEMVEVFSLRMNPRLVVLSACESGIGSLEGGDEVQGLNRAFLYAGAGGVLASLWSVSDESTFLLMESFYEALEEKPPAEALRAAQLGVMETFPEPFHWGAFYLTGSR
jgi:CHAT domain-containing protein